MGRKQGRATPGLYLNCEICTRDSCCGATSTLVSCHACTSSEQEGETMHLVYTVVSVDSALKSRHARLGVDPKVCQVKLISTGPQRGS